MRLQGFPRVEILEQFFLGQHRVYFSMADFMYRKLLGALERTGDEVMPVDIYRPQQPAAQRTFLLRHVTLDQCKRHEFPAAITMRLPFPL